MSNENFVVFADTEEEFQAAQKALFQQGVKWPSGMQDYTHTLPYKPRTVLYVEGKCMSYSDTGYYERSYKSDHPVRTLAEIQSANEPAPALGIGIGDNPKQGIGSTQLPMGLVSPLFKAYVACAKHNGKGKYGLANFIGTEVVMSIYLDAAERHLDKLKMGEWADPADGVPHIGAIGACLDIITSAKAAGTLIDDRPRSDGQLEGYYALTPLVKELTELHADKKPYHYYARNKDADIERQRALKAGNV